LYKFNSENAHSHTVGKSISALKYSYTHMVHIFYIQILADQTLANKSNMSKLYNFYTCISYIQFKYDL